MSDGCTDVHRDDEREEVVYWIRKNESKFENKMISRKVAEKLLALWKEFKSIKRGYWTSSSQVLADYMIEKYETLLETGHVVFDNKLSREINGEYNLKE